ECETERTVSAQYGAHEARGYPRHQVAAPLRPHGGRGGHQEKPFIIAAAKPATATPTSTAVARRMRLSASVHAMHPPQITGTISPPITNRVCGSPEARAA